MKLFIVVSALIIILSLGLAAYYSGRASEYEHLLRLSRQECQQNQQKVSVIRNLWQESQFDRATKQHQIEALQKKVKCYRRVIESHGIRVYEDQTGVVLELAPEVSNPEKKTEEPQS